LHYMTPKADDGDIVGQKRISISDYDTARSLYEKMVVASRQLLDEILPQIKKGTVTRQPQDHAQATYYGGRRPKDGEINWATTATHVRNLVRAVTIPYPGAFSYIGDRKCFFWMVTEMPDKGKKANPGTIISLDPLVIQCGKGSIRVDFGQAENGIYMGGAQLARELNLVEGMTFGLSTSKHIEMVKKKKILI